MHFYQNIYVVSRKCKTHYFNNFLYCKCDVNDVSTINSLDYTITLNSLVYIKFFFKSRALIRRAEETDFDEISNYIWLRV